MMEMRWGWVEASSELCRGDNWHSYKIRPLTMAWKDFVLGSWQQELIERKSDAERAVGAPASMGGSSRSDLACPVSDAHHPT